jgi:hypothetical protein
VPPTACEPGSCATSCVLTELMRGVSRAQDAGSVAPGLELHRQPSPARSELKLLGGAEVRATGCRPSDTVVEVHTAGCEQSNAVVEVHATGRGSSGTAARAAGR